MGVIIDLEQAFAKKLGMRSTAEEIFQDLRDYDEATLDFNGITFISRSFTQEYVYQKRISNIKLNEINKSNFVEDIIKIIEKEYEDEFCEI